MKLNNHGWGMRDMIIYTCILLLFLLFVAYSVNSLYDILGNTGEVEENNTVVDNQQEQENEKEEEPLIVDVEYYNSLEENLKKSTLDYLNTYPTDLSSGILKITSDTLIGLNLMDELYDQTKENKCIGYSNVFQEDNGDYIVDSYINCSNYTTQGY